MFSGIVEESATVVAVEKEKENMHFTLKCSFVDELKIDQSVAHNGVCLTVVKIENGTYTVTAMKETLDRSNLGLLKPGDELRIDEGLNQISALHAVGVQRILHRGLRFFVGVGVNHHFGGLGGSGGGLGGRRILSVIAASGKSGARGGSENKFGKHLSSHRDIKLRY